MMEGGGGRAFSASFQSPSKRSEMRKGLGRRSGTTRWKRARQLPYSLESGPVFVPFALAAAFRACSFAALPTPPIPLPSTLSVPAIGVEPVAAPDANGATPPADGEAETAVFAGGAESALPGSGGIVELHPAKITASKAVVKYRMV